MVKKLECEVTDGGVQFWKVGEVRYQSYCWILHMIVIQNGLNFLESIFTQNDVGNTPGELTEHKIKKKYIC